MDAKLIKINHKALVKLHIFYIFLIFLHILEFYFEYCNYYCIFANVKLSNMRIIARKTLITYYTTYPQAKEALEDWYHKTTEAEWNNLAEIRKTFNSVDYVGNQHYVFNIKGNDFRLVVVIRFTPKQVFIRFIGTHAEYDKITDIKNI